MCRYFTSMLCAIVAVIGFGCQSSSQKNSLEPLSQSIKINLGVEPQTLDPRKARDLKSQTVVRMLFDGLTRINSEDKAELAVADRISVSADLKTYTFFLKDSSWSNGDPVTASDFVYAWKKILSPDFPSDIAFNLYVIKNARAAKEGKVNGDEIGLRVLDEKTLVVDLENPAPYFLELTASPVFFPVNQKIDEKNPSWAQEASTYVNNGPFQLVEWRHQDQLTFKKNSTYWDAQSVKMDSIELQIVQEETELKMFEKKDLDWAGSPLSTIPVDALKTLQKGNHLKTKELLGTYFIRTNTERAPLNHRLIRTAFALAVNRSAIIDHVTQGNQIPATGLVPIALKIQKEPYFQDADFQKARKLFSDGLEAIHLKKEMLPEICLSYPSTNTRNHLIAQAIQQQWFEAFGIRVRLEAVESKVYYSKVSKKDFDMALGDWIADFADPINFLEVFKYKNGGSNNTCWENLRFIELLDKSSEVADQEKRLEMLAQSEQILMEEMPVIPIFYYTMLYLNQPSLKDVVLSSMGNIDFKWASIESQAATTQGDVK